MNHNPITTHILDSSLGKPAVGVTIKLLVLKGTEWQLLSSAVTNSDGRIDGWEQTEWYQDKEIESLFATYKICFELESYWEQQSLSAFYPSAEICFRLQDERHHHIPLLLSPYSYSTYRGS